MNTKATKITKSRGTFFSWRHAPCALLSALLISDLCPLSSSADIHYVDIACTNPVSPYTNWPTAATVIQDAIDQAESNDTVLVTDGVYETGGAAVFSNLINRIAITKAIAVRSMNGPGATVIKGTKPVGDAAVRCAYVTNGALLAGFTLTNGATRSSGDVNRGRYGGGVWCESGGVVSNCVIVDNAASLYGGGSHDGSLHGCTLRGNTAYSGAGSYLGNLYDCTLTGNTASQNGGGSLDGTLHNCTLSGNSITFNPTAAGGGASGGTLYDCLLASNSSGFFGGGASYGTLYNSVFVGNSTLAAGGGGYECALYNCLLRGNTADWGGGDAGSTLYNCTLIGNTASLYGGGSYIGVLYNCIVYFNTASNGNNYYEENMSCSCTVPLPTNGFGNIATAPQFVDTNAANYALKVNSPCIDKGFNQDWMTNVTDLAGNLRIVNGRADMGAYEVPFTIGPRAWLQGAYDTNQSRMITGLRNQMPLTSPYKADQRSVLDIPSNVTDWVLVQLRETNGNAILSRSAFVDRNGFVLADGGTTGLAVDVSTGTNCYLVLQHRNHLAVMSAQPLAFTNILTTYDFTTNWTVYYGGSNAAVQLKPGAWGMIAGDADGDGKITETDKKIVEQQKGRSGYLPGDLNLDGVVE